MTSRSYGLVVDDRDDCGCGFGREMMMASEGREARVIKMVLGFIEDCNSKGVPTSGQEDTAVIV